MGFEAAYFEAERGHQEKAERSTKPRGGSLSPLQDLLTPSILKRYVAAFHEGMEASKASSTRHGGADLMAPCPTGPEGPGSSCWLNK